MCDEVAYHEAGHAFMAIYVGARVRCVTVDPDNDDGPPRSGDTQVEWPLGNLSQRDFVTKSILVALAGPVAEMLYRGEPYHPGVVDEWTADWVLAWQTAEALFPDESKRMAFLEQTTVQVYRMLDRDDHWAALAALVDNLLAHETLEGEEVADIVASWMR